MPTVAEFAEITKRIIARDGFSAYLPTAIYPARNEIVVLEGVPDIDDLEEISVGWAEGKAIDGEEFLVAFKKGPTRFKVVRRYSGLQEDAEFDVAVGDV
jgi:hypothetical protein